MSTVDPDELAKVVPQAVADALLALIGACGKHKVPMAALMKSPEIDRFQRQEAEKQSLIDSLAKATVLILQRDTTIAQLRKQIAKYEEQLGIDNEI